MASKWTLTDLTEFDLRMHKGMNANPDLSRPIEDGKTPKDVLLRQWTQQQREQEPEARRLAELAVQSVSWLGLSLWIFSLLAGISAAAALLRYEGDRLINISAFLGILVGGQLLTLVALAISAVFLRRRIYRLQSLIMPKLIKNLSSPQSLPAWRWQIFGSFQQAGIAFNLGVLSLSLWKVLTYDLAFGWATTLNAGAEGIHRITQTLAAPWGGKFAPDLNQIEQSRIVLKSGLAQIDSSSTAAWWPFLLMCVLCYGLLPRLLLSVFARIQLYRTLKNPRLDAPESERLYRALTRKALGYQSDPASPRPAQKAFTALAPLTPSAPLQLDISPELLSAEQMTVFKTALENNSGLALDPAADGRLIVVEVWQPPLEETLRHFRDLRKTLGPDADILLLGVGFPDKVQLFQPPATRDLEIWQHRLSELNDPGLGLLAWRSPT